VPGAVVATTQEKLMRLPASATGPG